MKYRTMTGSDIKLSEIGLGCASYWGKKLFSEKRAIEVVHCAIDHGVNYFDTGHSYSGGYAELRLGKALKLNRLIDNLIISSKVGTRIGNYGKLYKDFSPQWIKKSCEQSLKQLQIDHIPIFFLHGPNPEDFNESTYDALSELQQSGKIGIIGVNSFADHIIQTSITCQQFEIIMLDFNILTQHRKKTIEQLNQSKIDVVVAGALAGGIYDYRFKHFKGLKSVWYWIRAFKNNRELMKKARKYNFLNQQRHGTAIQLALAYVLQQKSISSALIGTTSVSHLEEIFATDTNQLNHDLIEQIESSGKG